MLPVRLDHHRPVQFLLFIEGINEYCSHCRAYICHGRLNMCYIIPLICMHAGKHKEAAKAEPKTYQNSAAQHKAKGLFAASGSTTERQPNQSRPTPPARQGSARPQPAVKPLVGKAHCSTSEQPMSTTNRGISSHPISAQSRQQGVKQATATRQKDGSHPPEARREAVVMLEDAEINWDVADIQKVQQRARNMTGMAPALAMLCSGNWSHCRAFTIPPTT